VIACIRFDLRAGGYGFARDDERPARAAIRLVALPMSHAKPHQRPHELGASKWPGVLG
jgi:hypothetical protein